MIQNVTAIIVASVTFISFVGSIIVWVNILKYRVDSMQKTTDELRKELRESTQEIRTVITTVKAFADTQKVINEFTSNTLNQIVHRLDMIESRLSDYGKPDKN